MKKILFFNPGIATLNLGDQIIAESAKYELYSIFNNDFILNVSTHSPLSFYQIYTYRGFKTKIVLGSNLLKSTILGFKRQWDITILKSFFIKPVILLGVGWWQYNNKPNFYTRILLKNILSKNKIHGVRDEFTKKMLNKIGIKNVINTGCPTLWQLTTEKCKRIPKSKADKVIFTLTDYNKNLANDKKIIDILVENYSKVYFWPQGSGDLEYFHSICSNENVVILKPSLESFDDFLSNNDSDYVGTRLHAGIRALQYERRTIIISIDNRANEMNKSHNIPIISRENIENLKSMIFCDFETKIELDENSIKEWKSQFGVKK